MIPKDILIKHMENGGQIFRYTSKRNERFFYKIEDGKIMCRCNELGGWHPAVAEPKWSRDEIEIATIDYDHDGWREPALIRKRLPTLEETTGEKEIDIIERQMDIVRSNIIKNAQFNNMDPESIISLGNKFKKLRTKRRHLEIRLEIENSNS